MCTEPSSKPSSVDTSSRFFALYHVLVSLIILLSGAGIFALGIWLHATDNGLPLNLHYAGDNWYGPFLRFGQGFMILGAILLLTAVLALVAFSRRASSNGRFFRVLYAVFALIIAAALAVACTVSTLIVVRGADNQTRAVLQRAWGLTARFNPVEICAIERHFQCRGFGDGDCDSCLTGLESTCSGASASAVKCAVCGNGKQGGVNAESGCYGKIVSASKAIFRPVAVGSGIVAGVVVVDVFVSWAM